MVKVRINNTVIKTYLGDILKLSIDAIVSGSNTNMNMNNGISELIKEGGGKDIEDEALAMAPVETGKVVVTAAGALNAKHIIHAVAVDTDLKASERTISDATENSLLAAEELGLESIVFPPLGTILGGVLVTDSVRVMVNKVKEHVDKPTSLKLVIFGVACPSMQEIGYKAFRDEVKQLKKNREGIETRTKIEEAINEIKKFFRWTAGVELVDVRERIVKLKIESTCPSCLPPQEILKEVEKLLREYVPEIERVDLVQ